MHRTILNVGSCRANAKRMSPIELLTGNVPNLSDIVTFGTNDETKGFKVYLPKDRIVITTQHIKNVETLDSKQNEQLKAQLEREDPALKRAVEEREGAPKRKETSKIIETSTMDKDKYDTIKSKKKKSKKRSNKKKNQSSADVVAAEVEGADSVVQDPKNYRQAMRDPRSEKWKQAIREEIEALEQNETWCVVKTPEDAKLLHTKWVFKLKTHADGTVERYKARLLARGDQQEYGVDYTYTFSAVLELVSGRIILVVSRIWNVPASDEQLRALGVTSKYELALLLENVCTGLSRRGDCEINCCTRFSCR
ncbi:putative mitochondrial protein [Phytophthora megakarya]|uniref:Putative mitochondrial protein n=1 Tax=Phytophthora megakarya TaxID=4795 RepID=A0A225VLH4_9STRA|nr:putative mitochondrial protein [Phytophthora megakarya]